MAGMACSSSVKSLEARDCTAAAVGKSSKGKGKGQSMDKRKGCDGKGKLSAKTILPTGVVPRRPMQLSTPKKTGTLLEVWSHWS